MTAPRYEPVPPDRPTPALVEGLGARAWSSPTRQVLDAALELVVTMCEQVISHADGVSITLPRQGQFRTVAASNDVVLAMDHDQYDTGQGPCLDAARRGERFHIDVLADESRWAQFVPRARARGIESVLSCPLLDAGTAHGALNIYARTAGAFAVHEKQWADQFALRASEVLTAARRTLPSDRLDGQLEQALLSRAVIARAQGWMMHRDGLSADDAWLALSVISRRTDVPLFDVCSRLLDNTEQDAHVEGGESGGVVR